jgi:hypothetical protein
MAGRDAEFGEYGVPVCVIGAREKDSAEKLSVWRAGFVHHPKHRYIYTSAHVSGLIPIKAYHRFLENIRTADDIVELRNMINKFYGTAS